MDEEFAYKELEREFESTFINELMPGVLHNFANPLNGIMGRSKLLQRRIEEYLKKIQLNFPDIKNQLVDEHEKLSNDVQSICKESDRFFYMFQDLASKFYAVADRRLEHLNLASIIENEIRFLDFYLDFKHEIKKNINLNSSLPYIYGVHSDYSYCFSALFRDSMARMKKSTKKELFVGTEEKKNMITVVIQDTGQSMENHVNLTGKMDNSEHYHIDSFKFVQMLLKKYHVKCVCEAMNDSTRITVMVPLNIELPQS
jgi:signal transduction histidine kinase